MELDAQFEPNGGGGGGGAVNSVNGKTGTVVLDAGDLEYDDSETYAAGSVGAELSSLKGDLDALDEALENAYGDLSIANNVEFSDRGGSNRLFIYLYQNDGDYIADTVSPLRIAVQGWDTPTFDGNNVYNTGWITTFPYKFTINSAETGLYYRVVFGPSSGSISDAEKAASKVAKLVSYQDAIMKETNIKNNSFINNNIMVIAHGNTSDFPANNLEMYRTMYRNGIKYWECDVRKCADGYVLCHDDDIYNHALTANGETIAQGTVLISESTVATLQTYKFGILKGKQADGLVSGYENTTIPTLQEFTLLAKALGCIPVYEIKFNATESEIADICNIIKSIGMFNQSYFLAYGWAQRIAPYLCNNGVKRLVMSISGDTTTAAIDTAYGYIESYIDQFDDLVYDLDDGNYNIFDKNYALYASSKGFRVIIYGIYNTTKQTQILSAFQNGASGFITNKYNPIPVIQMYYD